MSTRGVIARKTGEESFTGVYHHWDSYPSGLGHALWKMYRKTFNRNLDEMLRYLLSHEWSTVVNKDLRKPPGYQRDSDRPQCYCHGERKQTVHTLTEKTASTSGCEYCYAFYQEDGKDKMAIYSSYCSDGKKMIGMFGAGDPEATWKLESKSFDLDLNGWKPAWKALDFT